MGAGSKRGQTERGEQKRFYMYPVVCDISEPDQMEMRAEGRIEKERFNERFPLGGPL